MRRSRGRHVGHIGVFGDGVAAQPQPPRDLRPRDPRGVHHAYIIDIIQGHGHLLHPFRAGPSKAFARKTIRRGPRPWFLGCGPHDQNAQFLMRTVLKSRRSFGPICYCTSTLRSSLPPEDRSCEARLRAGCPSGSWRRSALRGAVGSAPSPSVPRQRTSLTVARCFAPAGHSSEHAISSISAEQPLRADSAQ